MPACRMRPRWIYGVYRIGHPAEISGRSAQDFVAPLLADASPAQLRLAIDYGAGRAAGIRPQDLVGAIANETSLGGRDIGAIEIADRFSLVEVPEAAADEVIAALKASSVKGRRAPPPGRPLRWSGCPGG